MTCLRLRPHANLVTLIGVTENLNQLYIISEYCYGGTLFSLLHESKALISWQNKIEMARQIAQGMLFLHSNNPQLIHRDLKSLKYIRDII
jgi:serine/threonine protein kinase